MSIVDELAVPEITAEKAVGLVFLYASAALLDAIGGILGNITQLRGVSSVVVELAGVVFFVALVLTVYVTGNYLRHTRRTTAR